MKTPLRSRDVNIKPIYSVGVTNGAVLRNEVQYQKGVFYWVLKLIQDFFGFAEKSPLKKSSAKLKAIAAWWFTFLHAFLILNTYWFWEILIECHKEPGLHWLSFTSLCDWSRKLTSRPIRYKTKPIRDYITKKFASKALYLTASSFLLLDVIAQYAGTLCMVNSSSNLSDSGNRGFKPGWWTQARILYYRVLIL